MRFSTYKGWDLSRTAIGAHQVVATRAGVTMHADKVETIRRMIDLRPTLSPHDILPGEAHNWGLI